MGRFGQKGQNSGNYPAQLSGGQQQRVAIARALAMNPESERTRAFLKQILAF